MPTLPIRSAVLESYRILGPPEAPTGSTMCWRFSSQTVQECYDQYGVAERRNKTRCCDSVFTKFKIWPSEFVSL